MKTLVEEKESEIKSILTEAYNKGIDHSIDLVKSYRNIIHSQVTDLVLDKIIEDLKKLK